MPIFFGRSVLPALSERTPLATNWCLSGKGMTRWCGPTVADCPACADFPCGHCGDKRGGHLARPRCRCRVNVGSALSLSSRDVQTSPRPVSLRAGENASRGFDKQFQHPRARWVMHWRSDMRGVAMGVLLLMFSAVTLAQVQQIDLAEQLAAGQAGTRFESS